MIQGNKVLVACSAEADPELQQTLKIEWFKNNKIIGPNLGGEFNVYKDENNSLGIIYQNGLRKG